MNAHIKRWITGIITVPILFLIIGYGSEDIFAALIIAVILTAYYEYNALVFNAAAIAQKWEGMVIAFLMAAAAFAGGVGLLLSVTTFSILGVFILFLFHIHKSHALDVNSLAKMILGLMYIPFMLSYFIFIRRVENGALWIFFILILAFCGDISAFYVGRTVGKRKLAAMVSPGKTVEGTLALIAGSTAGCMLFKVLFFPLLPLEHAVVIGFVGSIIGQLGDLCESAIKRASGVKDSGSILMGHGGLLDRLDCLIFIVPFVYYYKVYFIR